MPIRYNRSILQQHADELYDQADGIVLGYALSYALASGGPGALAAGAYGYFVDGGSVAGWMLAGFVTAAVIGFAIGWQVGERAAFRMRLQAQELLCQMMIERNTSDRLRLSAAQTDPQILTLDNATLQMLRPGKSLRARMRRLGQ